MTKLIINNPTEQMKYMLSTMGCTFTTVEEDNETVVIADTQPAVPPGRPENVRHFDNFIDLLRATGLSQFAFARAIGCSARTVQGWCAPEDKRGHRDCAPYLLDLMSYFLGL